jgi:hypothetical protein
MKNFPPLQPLTERKLPTSPDHGAKLMAQTLYGASIDPRLALLLPVAACPPLGEDTNPQWAEAFRDFTAAAGAALVSGDISFFSQVVHCLERVQSQNLDMNGLDWFAAYAEVQMNAGQNPPPPPAASVVADAKNNHDKKTAIPAVDARDACRKLKLPLAEGSRGKKRKVEKPQ